MTISVSINGRYLLKNGNPLLLVGDTAWEIFNELDSTEVDQYLTNRRDKGFNAMIVQVTNPVKYYPASYAPGAKGAGGALPFLLNISGGSWTGVFANHDAAFSSPNDTYWDWVDYVIDRCNSFGFTLVVDHMYMGYNQGAEDGWWQDVGNAGNTQPVCFAFGQYLGNRWKNHQNLILDLGTDMFPVAGSESSARFLKILDGMQDAGCSQLVSAHYKRSSDARDYADYASRVTLNSVYPCAGGINYAPDLSRTRNSYAKSPAMPCAVVETKYEYPGGFTRVQIRQLGWWGQLSAIAGYFFGNSPLWLFDTGWQAAMDSDGSFDMSRMGFFFNSIEWWKLVPDGLGSVGTIITSGGGTPQTLGTVGQDDPNDGNDYVAAAAAEDGTVLVAYCPQAHAGTFTVDMTKMRGPTVQRWFDPTNSTYQSAGPTLANSGSHVFTPPAARGDGSSDWILRLDSPTGSASPAFGFWIA